MFYIVEQLLHALLYGGTALCKTMNGLIPGKQVFLYDEK
jgi:hypothetical protein